MKPWGPFRPEPPSPPPKSVFWKVSLALASMVLGIGLVLYGFHDAGAISDEIFLAVMVFVIALVAAVIIAMDVERQAHRATRERWQEVPPPFDFMTVWPPEDIARSRDNRAARHKSVGRRQLRSTWTKKP